MRATECKRGAGFAAGSSIAAFVFALVVLVGMSGSAQAAGKPRIKVTVKPAVVAPLATLRVSGRVSGRLPGSVRRYRVLLQERAGRRWLKRSTARLLAGNRFVARWKVPVVERTRTVRVRVVRGRREVARSSRWRFDVARPAIDPGVPVDPGDPVPTPTPDPGGGTPPPPPVQRQTQVIAPEAVLSAPSAGAAGTMRLAGSVAVAAGDVLAGDIGPAAPYGFLFKATAVRAEGGDTLVDVTPATLLEAVPEGSIHETIRFDGSESEGGERRAKRSFRRQVKCSRGGEVTIEGSADLGSPQLEIDADWGFLKLNSVQATASVTASASASATATGTASCTVGPIEIVNRKLRPIRLNVRGIPVWIFPTIKVDLSGLGEVQANVATSVDASLTARAGAKHKDGELSPIAELAESFDHQPPDPQGTAHLNATLTSSVEFAFYGVVGPEFTATAGLDLNADPEAAPWWTLDAPVSLTAALDIDLLDIEAGPIKVYERSFRLAEAGAAGRVAEAELTIDMEETATSPARGGGSCGTGAVNATTGGTVTVRSTKLAPLLAEQPEHLDGGVDDDTPDGGWYFEFDDTAPAVVEASLRPAEHEILKTCSYYDDQYEYDRFTSSLTTPSNIRINDVYLEAPFVFYLPPGLDGQPWAYGSGIYFDNGSDEWYHHSNWPLIADGSFGSTTNEKVRGGTAYRETSEIDELRFPLPPYYPPESDTPVGVDGVFAGRAKSTGTKQALAGTVTETAPGTVVIEGGSRYVQSGSPWWTLLGYPDPFGPHWEQYRGTGQHELTITARWKITVQR